MADSGGINFLVAFMLGTVALLVMAVAIISFVLVYQRRVIQHQLDLQKKDEEMQREMLRATILSQEEEQRRIARDLHDDLGPMLSAIKLKSSQIRKKMEDGGLDIINVDESKEMIDTTIAQVRGISHRLFPPTLEHYGLALTLAAVCEKMNTDKLPIEFIQQTEYQRISNEKELAIYRAIMELLNNIIRHSEATKAEVILKQDPEHQLEISVSDNGKGFDETQTNEKAGLGIKSIKSRIRAINADIEFEHPPVGTKVVIKVAGG